jgi:hypothetical protein
LEKNVKKLKKKRQKVKKSGKKAWKRRKIEKKVQKRHAFVCKFPFRALRFASCVWWISIRASMLKWVRFLRGKIRLSKRG